MVRTQVQLREEQAEKLRALATRRAASVASLIREAVDLLLEQETDLQPRIDLWKQSFTWLGQYHSGHANISEEHDSHLAEILAHEHLR